MSRAFRRVFLAAALTVMALVIAPSATAKYLAGSFGSAVQEPLRVTSQIAAFHQRIAMSGSWASADLECEGWRRLGISVSIDRLAPGGGRSSKAFARTGVVSNCSAGVTLGKTAVSLGWACPNGAFRPGQYLAFVATRHFATGLRAEAFLHFQVRGTC